VRLAKGAVENFNGLLSLVACRSSNGPTYRLPDSYGAEQIPRVIAAADEDLAVAQDPGLAFARLQVAFETAGARGEAGQTLERARSAAAEVLLQEFRDDDVPPGYYKRLIDASLQRNLAVRSRIAQARSYLNRGERLKSFRLIKALDRDYPFHAERASSGDVLADAGLSLAKDRGRYSLIFRYRVLAPEVLEYLTTQYPTHEAGPQAYEHLARLYVEAGELELAIQRHEDLIVYFGDSPKVPHSRAEIPSLRLDLIQRADFDRRPMELARQELSSWLEAYGGKDLEDEDRVRQNLLLAIRQLSQHDSTVSGFYQTVDNASGAELHARRALELAREGGSEPQITAAQEVLDRLMQTPAPAPEAPVITP
ncbi:MAG: hypothetical protein JKY61_08540, partial [Planctomycetes bacterium]|nr:hypothetical protein [Planctomycetota bacterium]